MISVYKSVVLTSGECICIYFLSLSLRTSQWVLASGEEREGSLFVFETDLAIYLFHSCYIVHLIRNWSSPLICSLIWISIWILHKSSIYCKSLDFFNIFEDFILVYCEIFGFSRIYSRMSEFLQYQGNFQFYTVNIKMVILVFLTNSFVQPF